MRFKPDHKISFDVKWDLDGSERVIPTAGGTARAAGATMKRGVDYIGVGVGAVLRDGQGRVFLSRRGPLAKNERGLWEFPGGSVEFGETLAHALQREMREEYGIEIEVGELLDVADHILPEEGQHWVSPTFICELAAGEPSIHEPGKCTEIGWFDPRRAPDDLTQITRLNLAHYLEK
jgi:mutator protein MutT